MPLLHCKLKPPSTIDVLLYPKRECMIYNISASPMFNKDNWLSQIDFFFHLENNKGFQFKIQEAFKRNISIIQKYHQIRETAIHELLTCDLSCMLQQPTANYWHKNRQKSFSLCNSPNVYQNRHELTQRSTH